jgi:integrase
MVKGSGVGIDISSTPDKAREGRGTVRNHRRRRLGLCVGFPCGHITTVAKAFEQARAAAGLPNEVVLYSARHTFATKVMGATGDLSLVMRALGHSSPQTAMIYQHPSLETVRSVVNGQYPEPMQRHNLHHTAIM